MKEADIAGKVSRGSVRASRMPAKARSKYGATKTTVDGVVFDSKREAHRYQELKLMQQSGQIRELRWQPRYVLFALVLEKPNLRDANAGTISQRRHVVCEYIADFEYLTAEPGFDVVRWYPVVEDVKSPATQRKEVYRLKRKLFEAQYGITILETR